MSVDEVLLAQYIDVAQRDGSRVWLLKGCDDSHKGGLTRSVRPRRPEIPVGVERPCLKRVVAIGILLGETANDKVHGGTSGNQRGVEGQAIGARNVVPGCVR